MRTNNFGLNGRQRSKPQKRDNYDHWFWESKGKKKIKDAERMAEIERTKAETEAVLAIINDTETEAKSSNIGQIAVIGGLSLLTLLGIGMLWKHLKKKNGTPSAEANAETIAAADLMV